MALGECPSHGLMKGHIRLKIAERFQGYFVVRTVRSCTEEDADAIRAKKEGVQQKRKDRRRRTSQKKREAREAENAKKNAVQRETKAKDTAKKGTKKGENV